MHSIVADNGFTSKKENRDDRVLLSSLVYNSFQNVSMALEKKSGIKKRDKPDYCFGHDT